MIFLRVRIVEDHRYEFLFPLTYRMGNQTMHILCTYSFGRLNDQYFNFHYFLHPVNFDLGIHIGICVPW